MKKVLAKLRTLFKRQFYYEYTQKVYIRKSKMMDVKRFNSFVKIKSVINSCQTDLHCSSCGNMIANFERDYPNSGGITILKSLLIHKYINL